MEVKANNLKSKLQRMIYFGSVIQAYLFFTQDKTCPFCKAQDISEVANKMFLVKLFRCNQCKIMFRFPKDRKITGASEYRHPELERKVSYLPKPAELEQLKQKGFKETIYDISDKIVHIKRYITEGNMLDYGASWGYNLWQFLQEGFSGMGFEISAKQAVFGEKNLGLKIIHVPKVLDALGEQFDVIFANHVLEHCQDIRKELKRIYGLLKTGGFLVVYVPDCTNIEKEKWRNAYAFGQRHPLAFSRDFFKKNLPSLGLRILEIEEDRLPEYAIRFIAKKEQR